MKFFKWRLNIKIERLDLDERIIYLARLLLKETMKKDEIEEFMKGQ